MEKERKQGCFFFSKDENKSREKKDKKLEANCILN